MAGATGHPVARSGPPAAGPAGPAGRNFRGPRAGTPVAGGPGLSGRDPVAGFGGVSRLTVTRSFLGRHRLFAAALGLGLVVRLITVLGFPPAIWFGGDSASYLSTALYHAPGTSRLSGREETATRAS